MKTPRRVARCWFAAVALTTLIGCGARDAAPKPSPERTAQASEPAAPVDVEPDTPVRRKVVVLELEVESSEDERLGHLLGDYLLVALENSKQFEVIGVSDMGALLEKERKQDLLGCREDTCLTELAGALDCELVVTGSIGRLGRAFLLTLKLIDTTTPTPKVQRYAAMVPTGDERLVEAIRRGVSAWTGHGRERRITLNLRDARLDEAMELMSEVEHVSIVVPPELKDRRITVRLYQAYWSDALHGVLYSIGLRATLVSGVYYISEATEP